MENAAEKKIRKTKISGLTVANYAILTLIAVICIVPFFNVVSKSFSTYGKTIMILPKGWTLYNYRQVFSTFAFFRAFFVSVGVTVAGTALSVTIMFMAAYPLSKKDLPFRGAIMVFFTIVMLFSGGIIPNFFVVKTLGLLNTPFALEKRAGRDSRGNRGIGAYRRRGKRKDSRGDSLADLHSVYRQRGAVYGGFVLE